MRLVVLTLLVPFAACQTRVHVVDVEAAFAADHAAMKLRVPRRTDRNPARAADPDQAMRRTTALARDYLAQRKGKTDRRNTYVRAILACALLARGQTVEARATVEEIRPRMEQILSRDNAIAMGTLSLVGACRAIEAHRALEQVVDGELEVEAFVRHYGSLAGVDLPDPDAPGYPALLAQAVERVRGRCVPYNDTERELARVGRGRAELRRLIGEQIYNEAAALLETLPGPNAAREGVIERWLAASCVGLFIVYGQLMPDLVPVQISQAQKDWLLEQAQPLYVRVRAIAAHFLTQDQRLAIDPKAGARDTDTHADYYRHLYELLLDAEISVVGWITTR
jgi:hypothetical protein